MLLRRSVAIVIGVSALYTLGWSSASSVAASSRGTGSASPDEIEPRLAFLTTKTVFIYSRSTAKVERVAGVNPRTEASDLTWSPDGRLLAWMEFGLHARAHLAVADLDSGTVYRVSVPLRAGLSTSVVGYKKAFVVGAKISPFGPARTFRLEIDPKRDHVRFARTEFNVRLRATSYGAKRALSLAAPVGDRLIAASYEDGSYGNSDFFVLAPDGSQQLLGAEQAGYPFETNTFSSQIVVSSDQTRLAYTVGLKAGPCVVDEDVITRQLATWALAAPNLPEAPTGQNRLVTSVTYGGDGRLVVTVFHGDAGPDGCSNHGQLETLALGPYGWETLGRGAHWAQTGPRGELAELDGRNLEIRNGSDSSMMLIAHSVLDAVWEPAA